MKNLIKRINKKIAVAIIIVLILVSVVIVFGFVLNFDFIPKFRGEVLDLTATYDIQQDYCGKAVDIRYCNCAFEGKDCELVSIPDKDTANQLITAGFESWVLEKKKEECSQKGGRWVKDECRE